MSAATTNPRADAVSSMRIDPLNCVFLLCDFQVRSLTVCLFVCISANILHRSQERFVPLIYKMDHVTHCVRILLSARATLGAFNMSVF